MTNIVTLPTVSTPVIPAIERGQMWRDDELDITYRTLDKRTDGWYCRCISGDTGKVWYDVIHPEAFVLDSLRHIA